MSPSFAATAEYVDSAFGRSTVLKQLGYNGGSVAPANENGYLPETWSSCFKPSVNRKIKISFSRLHDGADFLFIIEIFNTELEDSFLLDEWTRPDRNDTDPYPFVLSSYPGEFSQKVQAFVAFAEKPFMEAGLDLIVHGITWQHIPW